MESEETYHLWVSKYKWYCTEKIKNGKLVGICYDNNVVWYQGNNRSNLPPPRYVEKLDKHIKLLQKRRFLQKELGNGKYVIFCVFYGHGEDYVVTDVYDAKKKTFFTHMQLSYFCSNVHMPQVAIRFHGNIDEIIEFVKTQPDSIYNVGGKIDGLICSPHGDFYRNDGSRIWLKFECDEYIKGVRPSGKNE